MTARDVIRMVRTPVTLVVLLAVLGWGAWWGYKAVLTVPVSTANACVSQPVTELKPSQVTVRVLNGGDTRGLASDVAKVLKARGFTVSTTGNTDADITTPVIVGATVDTPAVKLVASNFTKPELRGDSRIDGTVDVLVGQNSADLTVATGYATSVPIPDGTACLPKAKSATPSASAT